MRFHTLRSNALIAIFAIPILTGCESLEVLRTSGGMSLMLTVANPRPDAGSGTVTGSGVYRVRNNPTRFEVLGWAGLSASHVTSAENGRWIYAATDDGVLVSRDGGQSFWLTGDTRLRSIRRVAPVPGRPTQVFAATAHGVFFIENITGAADAWRSYKTSEEFGFCSDVLVDLQDPETVWVGSERGVFVAGPGDSRFRRASGIARVRRLLQDRTDPNRLWAATDGEGLLESTDRGKTWTRVSGIADICYSVTQYPPDPRRIIVTGQALVWTRRPDGSAWDRAAVGGASGPAVYDIAFDPDNPGVALLGTSDGVFGSRNGSPWTPFALARTSISSIGYAKQHIQSAAPYLSSVRTDEAKTAIPPSNRNLAEPSFGARKRQLGRALARQPLPEPQSDDFFFAALSRLKEDRGTNALWSAVRTAAELKRATQRGELARRAFFLHCRRALPPKLRASMIQATPLRGLVRGQGEHSWLMYYATVLLTSCLVDDRDEVQWFNGLSTADNVRTARGWLIDWATALGHRGQVDFDSPTQLPDTLAALLLLHDFVEDPRIHKLATDALDLLLADYLSESLGGAWCGAHSHLAPDDLFLGAQHGIAAWHFLFAGGIERPAQLSNGLAAGAYSFYLPLPLLGEIANLRTRPFEVREIKRGPESLRGGLRTHPACLKYSYITQTYGMGSLPNPSGHVAAQSRWSLNWRSRQAGALLCSSVPAVNTDYLARFFAADRNRLASAFLGAFDSRQPNWVGGSPDLWTRQNKNTLLLLYDLPTVQRVCLSLPTSLRLESKGGWLFGIDDSFHVAIHASQRSKLVADPRRPTRQLYQCRGRRIGFVVIAGSADVTPPGAKGPESHQAFQQRVLASPRPVLNSGKQTPSLRYRLARGADLIVTNQPVRIDPKTKLFDSPFLSATVGNGSVRLSVGARDHRIEFGSSK